MAGLAARPAPHRHRSPAVLLIVGAIHPAARLNARPAALAAALAAALTLCAPGAEAQPGAGEAAATAAPSEQPDAEAGRRQAQDLLAKLLAQIEAAPAGASAAVAAARADWQAGQAAYRIGAWPTAGEHWQRALDTLAAARKRLAAQRRDQRRQQLDNTLSDAYQALRAGAWDDAEAHFGRGAQQDASAAADGIATLALVRETAGIAERQQQWRLARQNERWDEAANASLAALKINADLDFAQTGLIEARNRQQLDRELRALIDSPLNTSTLRQRALQALAAARALGVSPGARVATQRSELGDKMRAASRPVTVVFLSDEETRVTLLRVSQLGLFARKTQALLPGQYTALGQRPGYRDVRKTFTVQAGQTAEPITVRCEEKI